MINPQETQRPCGGKQNTETVYYGEFEGRLREKEGGRERGQREGERERTEGGRESAYLKFTKKPGGEKRVNHFTKQRAAVIRLNTPCTNTQNKSTHNKITALGLSPIDYMQFIRTILLLYGVWTCHITFFSSYKPAQDAQNEFLTLHISSFVMSNNNGSNYELHLSQVCLLIKAVVVFAPCFTEVWLLREALIWRGVTAVCPQLSATSIPWQILVGWSVLGLGVIIVISC